MRRCQQTKCWNAWAGVAKPPPLRRRTLQSLKRAHRRARLLSSVGARIAEYRTVVGMGDRSPVESRSVDEGSWRTPTPHVRVDAMS